MSLLSPQSATFFVLRLNKFVESDERASEVPRKCNFQVYEAFQPASHAALAQRLATACTQLTHIYFDVMGHTPTTYWTVTRSDGEATVRRLEPMVGRELVHREVLWFNDRSMGLS